MKKVTLVVAFLGCLGCNKSGGGTSGSGAPVGGDVVAKVGEELITLKEFEEQLNQQNPLIRARYNSPEQKKKLLDSLVEREAMYVEAQRLGLDRDPEMVRGYKKILARHLVNEVFNKKRVNEIEISDAEIQKYYEENVDRYHSPEKIRVHHVFLKAADPAARKTARALASDLLRQLRANPTDRRLFLELARQHSADEASKNIGGDLNFKTEAELEAAWGKKFAAAASALQKANDLSDIVETDQGLHILRQSGRQAKIDLSLEQVKGQIRTTLFARARGEAYKNFVEDIKQRIGVSLNEDAIARAKVEAAEASPEGRPPAVPGGPNLQPPGAPPALPPGMKLEPRPLPLPVPAAPPAPPANP